MAIREILTVPHPVLKQVSAKVEAVDDDLRALMDDMLATMYAAPGIGLAAVQIGVPKRVIVMDLSRGDEEPPAPRYFVNPEITWASDDKQVYDEGCLSVPGIYDGVERPARVKVRAQDAKGEFFELECDGLLAVCIQHEMDHLMGKVFVEYLSPLKRNRIKAKMVKENRGIEREAALKAAGRRY